MQLQVVYTPLSTPSLQFKLTTAVVYYVVTDFSELQLIKELNRSDVVHHGCYEHMVVTRRRLSPRTFLKVSAAR